MHPSSILEQARQAWATIPLREDQRQQALAYLEQWLTAAPFVSYLPQIEALVEKGAWSLLVDSFYRVIPFGTGGRRGPVGIGPNRINPYTISTSVQGHIEYLQKTYPRGTAFSVVIAYDVRQFNDLRRLYDPTRPNPILGRSSRDFARLAASVYAAHGITSYLLAPDDPSYISTPELSFLIRSQNAQGGLNVSASHNHPDDNGGKFYNEQGAQPIPPADQEMSDLVEKIAVAREIPFEDAVHKGLIRWITPAMRRGYIETNQAIALLKPTTPAIVAYSPMNGTGSTSVGLLLREAGYPIHLLPSQTPFDGTFTRIRYQIPNPEVQTSMADVIAFAQELNADIALATDPDADRIGMAAPDPQGGWRFFNGNEISVLVGAWCLQQRKAIGTLPARPIVIKTEVTTDLLRRVTESYGGACVGDLLVGCKYIADVMHKLETTGAYGSLAGALSDVIMGTEESHGVLLSHAIRDKDAASAALMLAEYASFLKAQGKTMTDALMEIFQTHGYFANKQISMGMEGAIGLARIREMQAALRQNPLTEIGGVPVRRFFDHWDEGGHFGPILSETDRSARNVLVFHLEDGARIILRPSGTEPKTKLYVEVSSKPTPDRHALHDAIASTEARAISIAQAFAQGALARIGITLPLYAFLMSDLIAIDQKVRLTETVLPLWLQKALAIASPSDASAIASLLAWLQTELLPISRQPKGLVGRGFQAFLSSLPNETPSTTLQILQASLDQLP